MARKFQPRHLFFNRDQSWLRFNTRVLEEAQDTTNPLLERLRFLAITANNLDEFVEIRVATLLQLMEDGFIDHHEDADDGLDHEKRLMRLADQLHAFVYAQHHTWTHGILPALAQHSIHLLAWSELTPADRTYALHYYDHEIDPLLTPVTIDPSHPFPRVLNKALTIALLLHRKSDRKRSFNLGIVTVPRSLPRFIELPRSDGEHAFLNLYDLIAARAEQMFPGYQILARTSFRITRNSNLYLQEEESRSLLESVRSELHNRRKGDIVRLEVESGADEKIIDQLRVNFELDRWQIFRIDPPISLARVDELYRALNLPDLKFPPFQPALYQLPPGETSIFSELRKHDIMLHHPFDCYNTVEDFISTVHTDDRVIAVKQTLYRTAAESPAFNALMQTAEEKDITVVVELMARFDEDSNIRWAQALEESGVQVFHGIVGRKTHCKLALIVRRDEDGAIRRYAHLGTGNYNRVTARFYTDIALFTARPAITNAVAQVLNYLTTETQDFNTDPLLVAPINLDTRIHNLIEREAQHARAGKPAAIIAKMNGLLDGPTIRSLYAASKAGVKIDLIVRGMCALRPGVPKLSENIRVRSIVGRFLEHSRIFYFSNDGSDEIYAGSADWMERNLHSRCEVVFPVLDRGIKHRLHEILNAYLRDNVKARLLQPNGDYIRAPRHGAPFSAQQYMMEIRSHQPQAKASTAKTKASKASKASTKSKSQGAHKAVTQKASTKKASKKSTATKKRSTLKKRAQ